VAHPEDRSGDDEEHEHADFQPGESVAGHRAALYAEDVERGDRPKKDRDDERARERRVEMRNDLAEIRYEQVRVRCDRGDAYQDHQPCDEDAEERSVSFARVEVRAAGLVKIRRDFGETCGDAEDDRAGGDVDPRAERSEESGCFLRQSEDRGTDDDVEDETHS
jgi:hypothetical protein